MKLQGKLLLNAILSLAAALALVGYIIAQLLQINSQNQTLVPDMLNVQQLKADLGQVSQSLDNYSFSMTESNKSAVSSRIATAQATLALLTDQSLDTPQQQRWHASIQNKFAELSQEALEAVDQRNSPEAKRQAARIQGIQNDAYRLDLLTKARYDAYTSDLTHSIRLTWQIALAGAGVLLIAAGWFNARFARRLARRTRLLKEAAVRIADGDLTVNVRQTNGRDELDELNNSFVVMVDNLRGIVQSIESSGGVVDRVAEELDEQNGRMREIVSQVATSTEELAIGSQRIAEDLGQTVEVVDEMQRRFDENLAETEESAAATEQALRFVEHGESVMREQLRIASVNRSAMAEVEATVRELENSAARISDMTEHVAQIAKQTTLLSLNASIEAARAGEAGKGFAVVAGEVNKLADQSDTAAKEIFTAVGQIAASMTRVKGSVGQSLELLREQEQAAASTEQSFSSISGRVRQIDASVGKLADDMARSRRLSIQVQQAVENISAVTEQSAAGSQEITASTDEQQRAFEEIGGKVKELLRIREEMQRELQRFRLEG
ncbi:HAMP domain-containing methyl-accepting chemotaxis protein [Saccharibacillus sp. CPCC 101409]|uniref:methyl-accepting chemotaxis protein n=1 Tax=Saccharibacillus sp. CPCC 101409 TaxID=3058041 RepID=UPI002673EE4D|nr:HAMP domain-containing methyl-accepting chemotaxis protein [Saccharibacillus sp. CPCC 101409]MDO3411914.1 HAMP domain-containing methyl-accepting chemotaxis protein [Saccharibacillus sp. CPCC 101409]